MDITEFTLRIIVVFIPGLITQTIIENLTYAPKSDLQEVTSKSLMYGFINYYIYYLLSWIPSLDLEFRFTRTLLDTNSPISFREIFITAGIAILTGFLISYLISSGITFRTLKRLKITQISSSEDVLLTVLKDPSKEWARIRKRNENIIYEGRIKLYSSKEECNEIFLENVIAYSNDDGVRLWEVDFLYLCLDRNNLEIEFPLPIKVCKEQNDIQDGGILDESRRGQDKVR